MKLSALFVLALTGTLTTALAVDFWGLKEGTPEWKSAGPLAFGPDGILFVSDPSTASIIALDTGDRSSGADAVSIEVTGLDKQVADLLDAPAATIADLAVHPGSGQVYLSCAIGTRPVLLRVDLQGTLHLVPMKRVRHARVTLKDPPSGERRGRPRINDSITDLAYVEGKVLVAGLTDRESPSAVHQVNFPFVDSDTGASLEIYHGAHGKYEDYSAIRTFVPFTINGEPSLLAGFVCTPLVKVPLKGLQAGKKVRGTTVAELGNRNRPLDMIVYEKGGKSFLLMANSARGVMKISTEGLAANAGLTERVSGGGVAGQAYETVASMKDVVQLDKLNATHAVLLVKAGDGHDLRTVELP